MQSVDLGKKLRLPDPSKAFEGVWKLLRKTRQQAMTSPAGPAKTLPSSGLPEKKKAQIKADYQRGRAIQYTQRASLR